MTSNLERSWIGVDPSRPWIHESADRARRLFANQGVHGAAVCFASLHPRAIEYLEQAPVLALAASHGGRARTKQERAWIAFKWLPLIADGRRLRDLMRAGGVAWPLRSLSATAIRPGVWPIIHDISRLVDPSTISQSMPPAQQRHRGWLADIDVVWRALQRRNPDESAKAAIFRWMVIARGRHRQAIGHVPDAGQIADFLVAQRARWNPRWTWQRLLRETADWHDAVAAEDMRSRTAAVSYGDWPDRTSIDGWEFRALRSQRQLAAEGRVMRHCVASYWPDVRAGMSFIYSVRQDGMRVATAEFVGGELIQIRGPRNTRVNAAAVRAARRFAAARQAGNWS